MKKLSLLFGTLAIALGSYAQDCYKLTDMTEATFAAGGDSQWSFEKYNYEDGKYSVFTFYGDSTVCNFLDVYNPERLAGKLITEIDGVTANGNSTWASNVRKGWSNEKFCSPSNKYIVGANSDFDSEMLCYVARDDREGFGYELYGNINNASVVTFTVPADGYYIVNGKVTREDCITSEPLSIVPRYRYGTATDINSLSKKMTMGLAFEYGESTGEKSDYDGKGNLANGASERFVHQTPMTYTFAFQGKKGDKVSFEVNALGLGVGDTYKGRSCWARTFFQQLDITVTDMATAQANENYVDPYSTGKLEELEEKLDEYDSKLVEMSDLIGNGYGQYSQEAATQLQEVIISLSDMVVNGQVSDMTASTLMEELENAWSTFINSQNKMDYSAENNFRLFYSAGSVDNGDLVVSNDEATMAKNEDNPWGYYMYNVSTGAYEKFVNHGSSNKSGTTAWYNGSNDWLYITDDGQMHPTTSISPAIMFTAPADGVYKVLAQVYRLNPNLTVNNSTFLRSRFIEKETATADTATYMYAVRYGYKEDGSNGKAPVKLEYFVNMKQGDKITFEEDCYLAGKNSSAGTQIMDLYVCSRESDENIFTVDSAKASGLPFWSPYTTGDATELKEIVAQAEETVKEHINEIGDGDGQYPQEAYDSLMAGINAANDMIAQEGDATLTQQKIDKQAKELKSLIEAFNNSRTGYHMVIDGTYSIRLAGSDSRVTRKTLANDHFYMAMLNLAGVETQLNKDNVGVTDYSWSFTFVPNEDNQNKATITDKTIAYNNYMCADGYFVFGTDDTPEVNTFTFETENKGDSVFAIRRADGKFWTGKFSWKSPYDLMGTSDTPQYIFVIDTVNLNDTYTGIENVSALSDNSVVKTEYFTADGRKASAQGKGLMIVRKTMANGTTKTMKIIK